MGVFSYFVTVPFCCPAFLVSTANSLNLLDCVRRAPKVSVTRERVSLCQKGVTPWLLFLVNCFCAWKRTKTSRGAGGVLPSTRPPAVERGRTPLEGGLGGGLVGRVIHNGALFNRVLIARSAHH